MYNCTTSVGESAIISKYWYFASYEPSLQYRSLWYRQRHLTSPVVLIRPPASRQLQRWKAWLVLRSRVGAVRRIPDGHTQVAIVTLVVRMITHWTEIVVSFLRVHTPLAWCWTIETSATPTPRFSHPAPRTITCLITVYGLLNSLNFFEVTMAIMKFSSGQIARYTIPCIIHIHNDLHILKSRLTQTINL